MNNKEYIAIDNKIKYRVLWAYACSFIIFGLLMASPQELMEGMIKIVKEPSLLITDYIEIGGIGATFLNAGIVTFFSVFLLYKLKLNISGISIAAIFLMSGFSLFGKNVLNIWFVLMGVFLYSRIQKDKYSKYIYIALFGTSMSPMISEVFFSLDMPLVVRLLLGSAVGIFIGFILPPLSSDLLRVHQGYNLYNVGFTSGIIGTIFISVFKSYGLETRNTLIWSTGNNLVLGIFLCVIFTLLMITGFVLNKNSFGRLKNVFKYSGRLICDLVVLEGFGTVLINMSINGFIGLAYVLIFKGELNGPTIGGILTMVGFGAFGKHARNVLPIMLGVIIGGLTKVWNINDPSILLAALFGTSLAPIAGQFGWFYGIVAGFINSSVVINIGVLHGGVNLYNTGFAAGVVAAFLVPIIEAFRKEES